MTAQARTPIAIVPAESDAELELLLAVRNAVDQMPISLATLRAREADDIGHLSVLAQAGNEIVGAGAVSWTALSIGANDAAFRVWVRRDRQRRGVGGQIYDHLLAFARRNGITKGFVRIEAGDEESLGFAARRGYEVFGLNQYGLFDLQSGPRPASSPPDGISIVSVRDRPDLHRALYDLEARTLPEVPSLAGMPVPPFEAWREHLELPTYLQDLSLLALADGSVIGSIQVDDDGDRVAWIAMLSVAPEMRRRGIGRALKLELARRAADDGWRMLLTLNDESNQKVRRLNEELGYRYLPEVLLLEATLP